MNLVAVRAGVISTFLSDGPFQVSIGLGASIVLLILVLSFSAGMGGSNPCVNSMRFLQAIWVFEHHPELSGILEQVEDPTEYNLRRMCSRVGQSAIVGCIVIARERKLMLWASFWI